MTTSWDCFDTLVARRHYLPRTVFDSIERETGLFDFTRRRMMAESRAPHTLDTIYTELAKDYGWDDETCKLIKQIEINEEVNHCFPVVENIQKVKDGDLIVSDMYLPAEAIMQILRNCGLKADVTIHVTTGGKSGGWIWNTLPPIDLHVGDNYHSDVQSPISHGIQGQHYTKTAFTRHEELFGGEVALLMRMVRLANPHEEGTVYHRLWWEQSQLNIPALVLAALELPSTGLAFIHRDCVHLQRIHEVIHGVTNTSFHCSRIALAERGRGWDEYVKECAYGKTLVDLQGSGRSIVRYWREVFNEMPSMIYVTGMLNHGYAIIRTPHDIIERYNSSRIGSLLKWPERESCEFREDYLDVQYEAIGKAVQYVELFHNLQPNKDLLAKIIELMVHAETPAIVDHYSDHGPNRYTVSWPESHRMSYELALEKVFGNQ
jgi:hypothetical protein